MRIGHLALAAVVSSLALGCGIPDIENRVSITQGVYGQLVSGCDTPGCSDRPITSGEVAVFDRAVTSGSVTATPVARTALDGAGFYQLAAPAGHYWLAWTNSGTSVQEIDSADGITRWDFTSGPGGGRWQER